MGDEQPISKNWLSGFKKVSAVNHLSRGAIQDEDDSYDPSTRIAPPPNRPRTPQPQYTQPYSGENSSYFGAQQSSPFQPASSAPQQQHTPFAAHRQDYNQWNGIPPQQNFSPPPPPEQNAYFGGGVDPQVGYSYNNQYPITTLQPSKTGNYTYAPPYDNSSLPPQPSFAQSPRSQTMYNNSQPPFLVQRSHTEPLSPPCPNCNTYVHPANGKCSCPSTHQGQYQGAWPSSS